MYDCVVLVGKMLIQYELKISIKDKSFEKYKVKSEIHLFFLNSH